MADLRDDLRIEPSSWLKSGSAFEEAAGTVRQSIQQTVTDSTDKGRINCTGGYALIDDAISTLLDLLKGVMDTLGTDIHDGLDVDGRSLTQTGKDYQASESAHVDVAAEITRAVQDS